MTKKQENDIRFMREKYYQYKEYSQYWKDAYKRPSHRKENAFWSVVEGIYADLDGEDIRVVHAGTQTFSIGFIYYDNLDRKHFVYVTKSKTRDCIVEGVTEVNEL